MEIQRLEQFCFIYVFKCVLTEFIKAAGKFGHILSHLHLCNWIHRVIQS